ncbi:alpha-tocopherol transfer protein-like [Macrosteles quadrilineatus]|uniref:alpha-tocopherol transfer protein-like n=1 Tax=Macrosteles quadrilineatus TaxID=74068 RepID=UPI0023E13AEC|nr:alpha-tocopherol transfer protein-like [Macrosteles quadrilineatus]XP_054284147.1 alpha-tocopherol transfer protein-like [Macrosteles quadrilineatus]
MPTSVREDEVGDVEADLDLDTLPEDAQEYARTVLGETPETRVRTVQELSDMIYERGDVMPIRMDDDYLILFLRARNFKVDAAYRLLVNYYTFRENNPDYYNVNPLDLSFIGEADAVSVMPYREQTGRRILIYKLGKWNPSEYAADELFKATLAILELGILEPRAQVLGGRVIWDLEGLTMAHYWQITPAIVQKVLEIMVTSFPMKVHTIHIVNESWVFDMIFNMFKPFLGKRYRDIMFFHGSDRESLHQHIQPKYLPKVYGGIRPDYSYRDWFESLRHNPRIIKQMELLGYKRDDLEEQTVEKEVTA